MLSHIRTVLVLTLLVSLLGIYSCGSKEGEIKQEEDNSWYHGTWDIYRKKGDRESLGYMKFDANGYYENNIHAGYIDKGKHWFDAPKNTIMVKLQRSEAMVHLKIKDHTDYSMFFHLLIDSPSGHNMDLYAVKRGE